ncbi:MAG: DNA polymerase domain-containing protein, partial [archaeon]
ITPDDMHTLSNKTSYHPNRYFTKEKIGVLPDLLKRTIQERDKIKYIRKKYKNDPIKYHSLWLQQFALKIMGNAYYGFLSYAGSRFYDYEMAD